MSGLSHERIQDLVCGVTVSVVTSAARDKAPEPSEALALCGMAPGSGILDATEAVKHLKHLEA